MIIQQKRSHDIHINLDDAKNYMKDYVEENKTTIKDGEILFAKYLCGKTNDIKSRIYSLRGIVNAMNPSSPYVVFDDANNSNIVRENLLYYSYSLVNKEGCLKPFKEFEAAIVRGSQIRSDLTFTFSFQLLPKYYSSTYDNNKVYFAIKNETTNKYIPLELGSNLPSYITQKDKNSPILYTINRDNCQTKERLFFTFCIDELTKFTSYDDKLVFQIHVDTSGSTIEYMRNPKLELGSEMTDYCENESMKQNYLYNKSIQYTKNVGKTLNNNIKALHKPKYNNIEVSFVRTKLTGRFDDVFNKTHLTNANFNFNVLEDSYGEFQNTIVNIKAVGYGTYKDYYVFPALKVSGYNEEKLYLNGYGADVIYYNVSSKLNVNDIKTNKTKQCVLTKFEESGKYSYYRINPNDITGTTDDEKLSCIPVDILFNENGSPRPFMVDSDGRMLYPKIGNMLNSFIDQLHFTSGTNTKKHPDFDWDTSHNVSLDINDIPKDNPRTPWKEGF